MSVDGDFPTLAMLNAAFGDNVAEQWLIPQLADLTIYTGAKNIDKRQQGQLARIIATEYYWLKISELLLFFHRFKAGKYGHFFGNVDPMVVTCSLREFIRERNDIIARLEQEETERRNAEARSKAISYEEYQRKKSMRQ